MIDHDGAGDELGEKGDIEQQLPKAAGPGAGITVDVDDVAEALKGIKGDADGQDDPGQGEGETSDIVPGGQQKIKVFKGAHQTQIHQNSQGNGQPFSGKAALQPEAEQEIDENAGQQQHIGQLSKGEKHQACNGKPGVFPCQRRQQSINDIGNWEEKEQEDRFAEGHR